MLPIQITVKSRPPEVSKRAWSAATKAGFQAAGKLWHEKFLPDHFKPGAAQRYSYRPRSRKYLEAKLKAGRSGRAVDGGRTPLVYTGLMRELLLGFPFFRAYPTRVTVRMHGPRYVSMRVFKVNQPDKGKELTIVTAGEKLEIAAKIKTTIRDEMRKRKGSK